MELSEFIETTGRAEKYFEKEYTTEQQRIMFDEVKNMSLEKYQKAITSCIRNCKFLPKLADILKASEEMNDVNYRENRSYTRCNKCGGCGYVIYTKILKNATDLMEYDYAARCDCANAEFANKKIPTFLELGIQPREKIVVEEWS